MGWCSTPCKNLEWKRTQTRTNVHTHTHTHTPESRRETIPPLEPGSLSPIPRAPPQSRESHCPRASPTPLPPRPGALAPRAAPWLLTSCRSFLGGQSLEADVALQHGAARGPAPVRPARTGARRGGPRPRTSAAALRAGVRAPLGRGQSPSFRVPQTQDAKPRAPEPNLAALAHGRAAPLLPLGFLGRGSQPVPRPHPRGTPADAALAPPRPARNATPPRPPGHHEGAGLRRAAAAALGPRVPARPSASGSAGRVSSGGRTVLSVGVGSGARAAVLGGPPARGPGEGVRTGTGGGGSDPALRDPQRVGRQWRARAVAPPPGGGP